MPVYFTRSGTEVRLKEPTFPEGDELYPRHTISISDGGRIQVSVDGDEDVVVVLNFRSLPEAQYTAMKAFFDVTTSWAGYTFQYQDWNQQTINNMRYMDGIHTFKRKRGNKRDGSLTLRKDLGV